MRLRRFGVLAGAILGLLFSFSAGATTIAYFPLVEVTAQTDVWVRAELVAVDFRAVGENERHRFGWQGDTEIRATLRVLDSAPALDTNEITIHWATVEEARPRFTEGEEYIAALKRNDDGTWATLGAAGRHGWFPVKEPYSLPELPDANGDRLWALVHDLRAGQDAGGPDATLEESWRDRLENGTPQEYLAAVAFFDAFPALALDPGVLVAAFDRNRSGSALLPTLELLGRRADEASTRAIVDMYVRDLGSTRSIFPKSGGEVAEALVRIIVRGGGDARCDILRELLGGAISAGGGQQVLLAPDYRVLGAIAAEPGADIDTLLVDMLHHPDTFGITRVLQLAGVWTGLARRGVPAIQSYLDAFLADPVAFDLKVRREDSLENTFYYAWEALEIYAGHLPREERLQVLLRLHRAGHANALRALLGGLTPSDGALLAALADEPATTFRDTYIAADFARAVERVGPTAALLPALHALAEIQPSGAVLSALYACGDREKAFALARAQLDTAKPRGDWRAVYDVINEKTAILLALGRHFDPGLVPLIEPFTRSDVIDRHRSKLVAAARASGEDTHDFAVRELERAAILALVRPGGTAVVPRLREIYGRDDIGVRIAAALALYALGDDTGLELVRIFAEHREQAHPEIRARWRIDLGGGGGFHSAVRYLEAPRADAVFLERLAMGFGDSDYSVAGYETFVARHETAVLQSALGGLSSADSQARAAAHRTLTRLTGQDFGFDPGRSPKLQDAALGRWRAYVAQGAEGVVGR